MAENDPARALAEQIDELAAGYNPFAGPSFADGIVPLIAAALRTARAESQEQAFRAGFQAGVNAVGKFGDVSETDDEAWAEFRTLAQSAQTQEER